MGSGRSFISRRSFISISIRRLFISNACVDHLTYK
jgi:hypothetical protein